MEFMPWIIPNQAVHSRVYRLNAEATGSDFIERPYLTLLRDYLFVTRSTIW